MIDLARISPTRRTNRVSPRSLNRAHCRTSHRMPRLSYKQLTQINPKNPGCEVRTISCPWNNQQTNWANRLMFSLVIDWPRCSRQLASVSPLLVYGRARFDNRRYDKRSQHDAPNLVTEGALH